MTIFLIILMVFVGFCVIAEDKEWFEKKRNPADYKNLYDYFDKSPRQIKQIKQINYKKAIKDYKERSGY